MTLQQDQKNVMMKMILMNDLDDLFHDLEVSEEMKMMMKKKMMMIQI